MHHPLTNYPPHGTPYSPLMCVCVCVCDEHRTHSTETCRSTNRRGQLCQKHARSTHVDVTCRLGGPTRTLMLSQNEEPGQGRDVRSCNARRCRPGRRAMAMRSSWPVRSPAMISNAEVSRQPIMWWEKIQLLLAQYMLPLLVKYSYPCRARCICNASATHKNAQRGTQCASVYSPR